MNNLDSQELPATLPPEEARGPLTLLWGRWRRQGCPDFDDFEAPGGPLTA
jgi:hypothetical protein